MAPAPTPQQTVAQILGAQAHPLIVAQQQAAAQQAAEQARSRALTLALVTALKGGVGPAKATYDAIFEEGKKAGKGQMQQRAQNGSFVPSGTTAVSGTAPHRAKNALEALQFAKQGLMPAQ